MAHPLPGPLPFQRHAFVERRKVEGYFLSEAFRTRPENKVGLIRDVLGFDDPDDLARALVRHGQTYDAVVFERRARSVIYNVTGPMHGPKGSVAAFVTCWELPDGERAPRCITVKAARRPALGSTHGD
jgi:hypothetical protein